MRPLAKNACQTEASLKFIDSSINKKPGELHDNPFHAFWPPPSPSRWPASAFAEGCDKVIFSDVGWTDITATTAATTLVLEALGYETETKVLSVPVTYTGLAEGDIDVFLGNWMPTMEADIAPYRDAGTVETVRTNLEGAKYTLATNEAGAALGITDFEDIADAQGRAGRQDLRDRAGQRRQPPDPRHDRLRTLRPGRRSRSSKARNRACWPRWRSETDAGKPIVFLGWEPHPMNANFKMTYLTGGDDYFGPNFGGADGRHQHPRRAMSRNARTPASCCRTCRSRLPMENEIMGAILNDGDRSAPMPPRPGWRPTPTRWKPWLDGVTTKDGGDAMAAVDGRAAVTDDMAPVRNAGAAFF